MADVLKELKSYLEWSILWAIAHLIVRRLTRSNLMELPDVKGQQGDVAYDVSMDASGNVVVKVGYKADVAMSLSISLFPLLEKVAASTSTPYDDKAIAGLEAILGIKKV